MAEIQTTKNYLEEHLQEQARTDASSHFWHRLRWRFIRRKLSSLPERSRVLDLGAGSGIFGKFLGAQGRFDYFFVEPLDSLRNMLCERYGATRDLTKATHYSGMAAILLLDVLEHIPDDRQFLMELREKMENSTQLLILVPARQELSSDWDKKLGHFRRYTTASLRKVGEEAGFAVLDSRYLFPQFYCLGLIRRLFSKKTDSSELPILPRWLDQLVYVVSLVVATLVPKPPIGSSAFVQLRRK